MRKPLREQVRIVNMKHLQKASMMAAVAVVAIALAHALAWAGERREALEMVYEAVVPAPGTETTYGIPLDWGNAELFLDWNDDIYDQLSGPDKDAVLEALSALVAPCCDDYVLPGCCCEGGGLLCNLVRTARGLAAYMVVEGGFSVEETRASVLEWLRFVHGDYYVAAELAEQGVDPRAYGLTTHGACYRGLCETPLAQGGCGGMHVLKIGFDGR